MTATATGGETRIEEPAEVPAPRLVDGWSLAIVVLGALQPLASYLNATADRLVWPSTVIWTAVVWTAVLLAAFVGVRLVTRRLRPVPVAAGFAAFNLSLWNFSRWLPYEPATEARRWLGLLVWMVATAVVVRVAMLLARLPMAHLFIVIFLGVWTASLLVSAGGVRSELAGGDPVQVPAPPAIEFGADRPNVYWLLLDEHARSDQLRQRTGYDNAWFSADLADRGFSVSETSTSSYIETHFSVTSTLAMDHIWDAGPEYRDEFTKAEPMLAGDNPVVETFEANGYRYVGAPDGKVEWSSCPDPAPGRSCIGPEGGPIGLREPYSYMLLATPLGSLGLLPVTHNDTESVGAGIDALRVDDQPFFLYAHLLTPHFPFRYEQDCSDRSDWVDGYNYGRDEFGAAYANDVRCVDQDVVGLVDRIIAADPGAVVIVQSDHGSRLDYKGGLDASEATDDMLQERFGALNAIRLPDACRGRSIEGEQLVNTFRIVFACLSDDAPDLLPERFFFPVPDTHRMFVEVDPERIEAP